MTILKNLLKKLDIFKVDKTFNISENLSDDEEEKVGSKVGGVFTIVLGIFSLS